MSTLKLQVSIDKKSEATAKRGLADLGSSLQKFDAEIQKLNRQDKLKGLAQEFSKQSANIGNSKKAVLDLNRELVKLGASDKEIAKVAQEFSKLEANAKRAQQATKTTGTSGGGVGSTSAIASFTGVVSPEFGTAAGGLEALKGAAGELGAMSTKTALSLGAMGVAIGAVMLVAQEYSRQAQEQAQQLSAIIDAERSVFDAIQAGMTTEQAVEQIERLNQKREFEADLLVRLQEQQEEYNRRMEESFGIFAPIFKFFAGIFDSRVQTLDAELAKASDNTKQFEQEIQQLNKAIDTGKFASNDAKQATEEAEQAERELESARKQQTGEAERIAQQEARERERLAQEAQRQAEQVAQANRKYIDGLAQIARQTADSIKDLITKTRRTVSDGTQALQDDLSKLQQSASDKQREDTIKALQRESDIYRDHARNLESIRDKAFRDEQDAVGERNFALVAQIRQRTRDEENLAQKELQNKLADEKQSQQQSSEEQRRALDNQRRDRLQAYQQQRRDLATQLAREVTDIRTGAQRKQRDAQIAYAQEQAQFAQHLQTRLSIQAQALAKESAMQGGASISMVGQAGGVPIRAQNVLGGSNMAQVFAGYQRGLQQAVNRTQNNTFNVNGAQSPQSTSAEIARILKQVGL
jgi:colicin import membrane protein